MHCSQIQSLEELSDRTNVGRRCFERVLMCKPYSIWFLSPGREWHDGLTYGTLGQEVCLLLTLAIICLLHGCDWPTMNGQHLIPFAAPVVSHL